ncbi:MAG: DoxX-like family protein [Gammaproteobacteria bacterium]|nr:DoxX-like family protein [Gammaproteobacteria bacterium]
MNLIKKFFSKDIHLIATLTIAFIWAYHGLVPKLLGPHSQELDMIAAFGINENLATTLAYIAGVLELLMAVLVLVYRNKFWPFYLTIAIVLVLSITVLFGQPSFVMFAFNPITINIAMIMLSIIAIRSMDENLSKLDISS